MVNTTTGGMPSFQPTTVPVSEEPHPDGQWKKSSDGQPNCGLLHDLMSTYGMASWLSRLSRLNATTWLLARGSSQIGVGRCAGRVVADPPRGHWFFRKGTYPGVLWFPSRLLSSDKECPLAPQVSWGLGRVCVLWYVSSWPKFACTVAAPAKIDPSPHSRSTVKFSKN